MLRLDKRLSLIADMVKAGGSVCDVGTDHGYLPAFLYLSGKCSRVTATDIKEGPLASARENCKRWGAGGVTLLLCDGLSLVTRDMADTVIIAGMGGEAISGIIDRASFLKDASVNLILQPMTAAEYLREYLSQAGFDILCEAAVCENARVYTVMQCVYCGRRTAPDELFLIAGRLDPREECARKYLKKKLCIAKKCVADLTGVKGKEAQRLRYENQINGLELILEEK